jgi:DNA-binding transcriptional MerR regulator
MNLSAEELAGLVNDWCQEHGIKPASGQAGDLVTVRNIRFYRSMGLLDGPEAGRGKGFGEKHRLQLVAIRLLQARGLALHKIQELVYGRTTEELKEVERRGLAEWLEQRTEAFEPTNEESWRMVPLSQEFMLVSRSGRSIPAGIRDRLRAILETVNNPHGKSRANNRSIE